MPKNAPQRVPCIAPWTHLYCQDSHYGPCCDILFRVGRKDLSERLHNTEAFIELFNTEPLRKLRKMFMDGEVPYACQVCIACGYHKPFDEAMFDGKFTEIAEAPSITPKSFSLCVDSPCNVNCVFCKSICGQRHPDEDLNTFRQLFNRMEDIGWKNVSAIRIGGGEPFFNPGLSSFIQSYDWTKLGDTHVKFTTNGTLLHENLQLLAEVKRAEFTVSVDATGPVYESLRRGAKWEHVKTNLELLSEYTNKRPGWTGIVHSIVMKSTLPYLAELMRLCHRLGFDYSVMNIHGKYFEENIFLFSDLLKGSNWRAHFDEAIATAEQYGFDFAHKELTTFRNFLTDKLNGVHKPIRGFSSDGDRLTHLLEFFASIKDNAYAVLGVDNKFIEASQAAERLHGLQFVADQAEGISDFMGYPFLDTKTLAQNGDALTAWRQKLDLLVVSCPSWEYAAYSKTAKELFPDTKLALVPIYDRTAQDNIEKIAATSEPIVAFCVGGAASMLLEGTPLGKANIVAFADNNPKRHGAIFHGRPVVSLQEIPKHADRVVILSEGFFKEITRQVVEYHGDDVAILPLFS